MNKRSTRVALALLAVVGWGGSTSCGEPEEVRAQCYFDADCVVATERCDRLKGVCVKRPVCARDAQCAPGLFCALPQGVCSPRPPDMGQDLGPDQGRPDMSTPVHNNPNNNDPNADRTPPQVTSLEPAPAGAPITLEQTFTITFSEAMSPLSISPFSILLADAQGVGVELSIRYDGLKATARPTQPLAAATPYTLTINRFAQDVAGNGLARDVTATYVTPFEVSARHEALARRWAPWIYQGIDREDGFAWRGDVPTTVDFDGDFKASNNKDSMLLGTVDYRARAYYHVTESTTHLFLFMVLYYPQRVLRDDATGQDVRYEHDMTGAVFVIERDPERLVIVEGLRVEAATDTLISYTLRDSGYDAPGEDIRARFLADQLVDGTRYPLYIPARRHEACNWHDKQPRPPLDLCSHPERGFIGGPSKGVLMRPGERGQTLAQAVAGPDGIRVMDYELVPLASLFWLRRSSYGLDGLFERGFTYRPDGMRPRGAREDSPHLLPNRLSTQDSRSFGKSPFQWLVKGTQSNAGQWMLDPAYELRQRYRVPAQTPWSLDYCDNLFFQIDRRGQPGCM